jgi:prevent-host-death family protein
MNVTATEAKNRLGQVLEQAQREPVFVEKAGRRHSVVISAERYDELLRAEAGQVQAPARRKRFSQEYKDWIAWNNELVEKHGIPLVEFRPW